jgi:thiamine-phosphate pyrophosphorylase
MKRPEALRIFDANLNRSREGLRVCEEIARFVLEDAALTRSLKSIRHSIADAIKGLVGGLGEVVAARDTRTDVGKESSPLEEGRESWRDLFIANVERSKEALRVLEETSKLFDAATSRLFKKTRFDVYAIEKRALPKLDALRDHRSVGRKKSDRRGPGRDSGRRKRRPTKG